MPRTAKPEIDAENIEVTCVYLVHFGPYVKIGITNNIDRRHAMLQHGVPEDLTMSMVIGLPGREMAVALERRIHKHLEAYRTRGEWFRIGHEEAAARINELVAMPVSVSMPLNEALWLADQPADVVRSALSPIVEHYARIEAEEYALG